MTKPLPPCPLCGKPGEPVMRGKVGCQNVTCVMDTVSVQAWTKLSAMADELRRLKVKV